MRSVREGQFRIFIGHIVVILGVFAPALYASTRAVPQDLAALVLALRATAVLVLAGKLLAVTAAERLLGVGSTLRYSCYCDAAVVMMLDPPEVGDRTSWGLYFYAIIPFLASLYLFNGYLKHIVEGLGREKLLRLSAWAFHLISSALVGWLACLAALFIVGVHSPLTVVIHGLVGCCFLVALLAVVAFLSLVGITGYAVLGDSNART